MSKYKYWKILYKNCSYGGGYAGESMRENYDRLILFRGEESPEERLVTKKTVSERDKPFKFKNKEWRKFHPTSHYGRLSKSTDIIEITKKEIENIINEK